MNEDIESEIYEKSEKVTKFRTYKDVPWNEILWTQSTITFIVSGVILLSVIILEAAKIIPENIENKALENIIDIAVVVSIISLAISLVLQLYNIFLKVFFKNKIYDKVKDSNDDI